jgi:hypothetical protein
MMYPETVLRGAVKPSDGSRTQVRILPPPPEPEILGAFDRISGAGPCSSVVEHTLGKGEVVSSIPTMGSRMQEEKNGEKS